MTKAYLSSTLNDLRPERDAVKEALTGRYTVVESYEADEQSVRNSCLDDVASCELYVGIVGLRYGFIPPDEDKSITELEFEAAKGLKRLVFLKSEDEILAKMTDAHTAEHGGANKIREFRDRLNSGKTGIPRPAVFSDAADLKVKLLRALWTHDREEPPRYDSAPVNKTEPQQMATNEEGLGSASIDYRFEIALSFAGDNKRDLVRLVAEILRTKLGNETVFFDEWFEAEIAGHDAHVVLQKIYRESSRLVVACVCEHYNSKPWTQDEWRAIQAFERDLRDAGTDNTKRLRLLPLRFGDGKIDGIFHTAMVPDVRERSAKQIADLVLRRHQMILKNKAETVTNQPSDDIASSPPLTPGAQGPLRLYKKRKQEKVDAEVIANVAFHPHGELMAYSQDDRLFLLKLTDAFPRQVGCHSTDERVNQTGGAVGDHQSRITDVVFSPEGSMVASSDIHGYVRLWSITARCLGSELHNHSDAVTCISFSPNARLFASAGYDEVIYLYKMESLASGGMTPVLHAEFHKKSKKKTPGGYQHDIEQIHSMAFSLDGDFLATGDQQGVLVVREVKSEQEVYREKVHNAAIRSMCFCPTNSKLLVTASDDTRVRLVDFSTGDKPRTLGVGKDKHKDSLNSVAFSHDGTILVSSACDQFVKLWNVDDQKLIETVSDESTTCAVDKVAFYPNSFDFATNSYSSDITLWGVNDEGEITESSFDICRPLK